ncbi:MAG: NUDIX hydrolase [Candidatus Woesearchaeota archaeon]
MEGLERLIKVSLAIPIYDKGMYLIRREKSPYKGLLGLPGGKVEEHDYDYYEALMREMVEEIGVFQAPLSGGGILYETIIEKGRIGHYSMHIYIMPVDEEPRGKGIERIPLRELQKRKKEIIPSDYIIIQNMFKRNKNRIMRGVAVSIDNMNYMAELEDITHTNYTL